ncbi:hypothetical protein Psch_03910 [Pelotomaculum schinkii]|uniref:Uncharacterized protein n=1 Tax=Pelotomaculum schinkii TaxID=78350 RepID=A0A4Y7R5F6_9FIRM|nr:MULTISPECIES: DUF6544 family protein [Pelotomaculum]TEB04185.1 hypothetical protein Psch_03910 [Pelotomaculum schinkii]TEB17789.1 hypothetical protein Psfp_00281 [Pelotomaculum sp. FP]
MAKKYVFTIILFFLILVISFLIYKAQDLKRMYKAEASKALIGASETSSSILTHQDIKHLPAPVQKYLIYVGAIGKEKVRNFRVAFDGEFKTDPKKSWAKMAAMQFSELDHTTRLYFLQMRMFGLPVIGLHKYADAKATMLVKLAGLITVADGRGEEMNQGETVTVFNDMCILAPASLIDKRIEWETVDPSTVKATFNNNGCKISALLYFNEKGALVNFVSDDRYYSPTGKSYQKVRWSTPVKEYKDYNGIKISAGGEAIWSFPEGDYCYARAEIKEIEYNCTSQGQ